MNSTPLISIALCTYNGEKFIRQQLNSILAQTYQNIEIIAVDDFSVDGTVNILKEYSALDSRVNVFTNEVNLGYTNNFEKALNLCSGELIAICDQDDIWHPDKLKIQSETISTHELVYHDSEFIDESGKSMNLKVSDKFNFYRGNEPEVFLYLNCVSGHSILMKSALLKSALPFPKLFHYDQWLAYVATCIGSIDFVDQCLVQYRQHDHNSTDILALKVNKKHVKTEEKIKKLSLESEWLKLCSERSSYHSENLVSRLYELSLRRNSSFFSLSYMMQIWQHRAILLFLLKKPVISKFFYSLRKAWGSSAKLMS